MPILGWRAHFIRRQLTTPRTARPVLQSLNADVVAGWLDSECIEDGLPFHQAGKRAGKSARVGSRRTCWNSTAPTSTFSANEAAGDSRFVSN
jgi:hypothetical protein